MMRVIRTYHSLSVFKLRFGYKSPNNRLVTYYLLPFPSVMSKNFESILLMLTISSICTINTNGMLSSLSAINKIR